MTTQAIGYRRCSTLGQVDGEGLGVQSDKIDGWCRLQGLDLVRIEEDAGISGATLNRPGLKRALEGVLALGRNGVLVVARLDRLGRSPLCQRDVRQLPLDISVPMGGEWFLVRAQAFIDSRSINSSLGERSQAA